MCFTLYIVSTRMDASGAGRTAESGTAPDGAPVQINPAVAGPAKRTYRNKAMLFLIPKTDPSLSFARIIADPEVDPSNRRTATRDAGREWPGESRMHSDLRVTLPAVLPGVSLPFDQT